MRKNSLILAIFLFLLPSLWVEPGMGLCSQNISPIDSLSALLKTDKEDTNKVNHLNALGWGLMYQNPDTSIVLGKQAYELATSLVWAKGIAKSNNNLGIYYWIKGDYSLSLTCHFKALEIREVLKDKKGIAASLNNIGNVYDNQGDYPKALEYYFKALKTFEELGNKKGVAASLNNIGIVYYNQSDYPQAFEYYFKSLKVNEELQNKNGIADALNNIGLVYDEQGDYPNALEYYFRVLKLNEELQNKNGIAKNFNNIGLVYKKQANYPIALEYFFKALKLNEELGNKYGIASNLGNIGFNYLKEKIYKEAEEYLIKALQTSTEIGALYLIKDHNEYLSELYSQTNRYQLAYEHYKQYTIAKDSLFNEDKSKEIGRLEMRHEIELAEMERERKEKEELKVKTQKTERRNLLEYSGIFIGLLLIGLLVTILGFVKVKPWMAEGITFFAFLLFFEFILVLLDPYMDRFTKGEPAYKLFINASVAAAIFPLNALFEKVIRKRLMKKK